jgi:hypothetical protein
MAKESDRKEKKQGFYSYFSSLTSPAQRWAFLFGKNK